MSRFPVASSTSAPLLALALLSCSLTTADRARCQDDGECRSAFGLGFTCGGGGYCEAAPLHPRCQVTDRETNDTIREVFAPLPDDLFSSEMHRDAFVLGTVIDATSQTHRGRALAVKLAAIEANATGGLEGRTVAVVVCTNEVNPVRDELDQNEATAEVVIYLADTLGVSAIIGPPSSGATEAAFSALEGRDTVIISPSATSPALTDLEPDATDENPGRLWRTAAPDGTQGQVIADDMLDRGLTQIAIVYQMSSYGSGLADVVARNFEGAGRSVSRLAFEDGSQTERDIRIRDAASGEVEEVLFISSQPDDISDFLLQVDTLSGFADKSIFVTDSAANSDVLADAADFESVLPRLRGSRPAPLDGNRVYEGFLGSYGSQFRELGVPDPREISFGPHAYDAAWIALYGAAWALLQEGGDIRGTTIARGLRKLSSGTPRTIESSSWPEIQDSFRRGASVDVEGASGALDYDPVTEETNAAIQIWTIARDGTGFVLMPIDTID